MATVILTDGIGPSAQPLGATIRRKSRAKDLPVVHVDGTRVGRVVRVHRDAAGNVRRYEIEVG